MHQGKRVSKLRHLLLPLLDLLHLLLKLELLVCKFLLRCRLNSLGGLGVGTTLASTGTASRYYLRKGLILFVTASAAHCSKFNIGADYVVFVWSDECLKLCFTIL